MNIYFIQIAKNFMFLPMFNCFESNMFENNLFVSNLLFETSKSKLTQKFFKC